MLKNGNFLVKMQIISLYAIALYAIYLNDYTLHLDGSRSVPIILISTVAKPKKNMRKKDETSSAGRRKRLEKGVKPRCAFCFVAALPRPPPDAGVGERPLAIWAQSRQRDAQCIVR